LTNRGREPQKEKKMVVTLKLKSGLDRYSSNHTVRCDINTERKVSDVLSQVNFPVKEAGIVLVDGRRSHVDCTLHGGETVKVFPHVFN
jgi:hypothetical protein